MSSCHEMMNDFKGSKWDILIKEYVLRLWVSLYTF